MSTSGTCGIIYKNKAYLSYNHSDSYPSGLGSNMVDIIIRIEKEYGWNKLKKNILDVKQFEKSDINDEFLEKYKEYTNLNVGSQSKNDPYCIFRELQGSKWINETYEGNIKHYDFNSDFIKHSNGCEFGYIINLDTMNLEFYDGYQEIPQINSLFGTTKSKNGFYPCKLVEVTPLSYVSEISILTMVKKANMESEENYDNREVDLYLAKISRYNKLVEIENSIKG